MSTDRRSDEPKRRTAFDDAVDDTSRAAADVLGAIAELLDELRRALQRRSS